MPWSPVTRSSQADSGLFPMFQGPFADLIDARSDELMGVGACETLPNLSHQAPSRRYRSCHETTARVDAASDAVAAASARRLRAAVDRGAARRDRGRRIGADRLASVLVTCGQTGAVPSVVLEASATERGNPGVTSLPRTRRWDVAAAVGLCGCGPGRCVHR